jgi:hypothetical protein
METGMLWLVVLAVLAVAMPAWLALARGLSWRPERARRSLAASAEIVRLIQNVQQHRGMSGAWLAGDKSFGARLPEKQASIGRILERLEMAARTESTEAYPCFRIGDLRELQGQWQALTAGLVASTPEKSFQDHCHIVARLLDWLRALGEARIEQPAGAKTAGPAVRNFSFRLPTLAECLGQARALSSASAARGRVAPVARVRLVFLFSRAESLLGTALSSTRGATEPEQDQAARTVQIFVRAMRERLLGAGGVSIPAAECFALATHAVDGVFAWQELERRRIAIALGLSGAAAEAVAAG